VGAIEVNLFRFIPAAILENLTRRALQRGAPPTYNFSGNKYIPEEKFWNKYKVLTGVTQPLHPVSLNLPVNIGSYPDLKKNPNWNRI